MLRLSEGRHGMLAASLVVTPCKWTEMREFIRDDNILLIETHLSRWPKFHNLEVAL